MKYKLKDLDNLEQKEFNKILFDNHKEIETYLKGVYTDTQKDIQEIIKPFPLSNTLNYLNIEIIEILSLEEFHCRTCSHCKKGMNEGYCISNGEEYYCSNKCLEEKNSKSEIQELEIGDDDSDSYWTEWEKEYEYEEYLKELEV